MSYDSNYFLCLAFHTNTGNIYTISLDCWGQSRYDTQIRRLELFGKEPKKYSVDLELDFDSHILNFIVRSLEK